MRKEEIAQALEEMRFHFRFSRKQFEGENTIIQIDDISNELIIDVYDPNEEIHNIYAIAQHGYYPDYNELVKIVKEHYGEKVVNEIIEKARKEYPKVKKEGYIGDLQTYVMEKLDELFEKIVTENFKKECSEWENQPAKKKIINGVEVNVKPVVVELWCPVNIPHYHYYRGTRCVVPLDKIKDKETLESIIEECEY